MSGVLGLEIKDGFGLFVLAKFAKKQYDTNRKGVIYLGALDTQHFALYLDKENNLVLEIFVLGVTQSVKISSINFIASCTIIHANLESVQNRNLLKLQIFNKESGKQSVSKEIDIPQLPMPVGGEIGLFKHDERGAIMQLAELAIFSPPRKKEEIVQINTYLSEKFDLGLMEKELINPTLLNQT